MTKDEALKIAIEALENNKRTHYYCEDTWYSCPKHEEGCANDYAGEECDCGADKTNQEFDIAIQSCKEALSSTPAQSLQEHDNKMIERVVTLLKDWTWGDGIIDMRADDLIEDVRKLKGK